jgi:hypothetical protein
VVLDKARRGCKKASEEHAGRASLGRQRRGKLKAQFIDAGPRGAAAERVFSAEIGG